MEEVFARFPHLAETILNHLSMETLNDCRAAGRVWNSNIENMNLFYIKRILKHIKLTIEKKQLGKKGILKGPDNETFKKFHKNFINLFCSGDFIKRTQILTIVDKLFCSK